MPRLRIIAGPNGSGKTSLTQYLQSLPDVHFGHYVNADEIQSTLLSKGTLGFAAFGIDGAGAEFSAFFEAHPLSAQAKQAAFETLPDGLRVEPAAVGAGYFSAIVADFVRHELIRRGKSFSFETVMSDGGKVALLETAKAQGYRTYLYFVCTVDPSINVERVAARVRQAGHDVPVDKIVARYTRALELLWPAMQASDRAYLFDNSGEKPELLAEFMPDRKLLIDTKNYPAWLRKYVLDKV